MDNTINMNPLKSLWSYIKLLRKQNFENQYFNGVQNINFPVMFIDFQMQQSPQFFLHVPILGHGP